MIWYDMIWYNIKVSTGAGELTTATLYPYWKDEPNPAIREAAARISVTLCKIALCFLEICKYK